MTFLRTHRGPSRRRHFAVCTTRVMPGLSTRSSATLNFEAADVPRRKQQPVAVEPIRRRVVEQVRGDDEPLVEKQLAVAHDRRAAVEHHQDAERGERALDGRRRQEQVEVGWNGVGKERPRVDDHPAGALAGRDARLQQLDLCGLQLPSQPAQRRRQVLDLVAVENLGLRVVAQRSRSFSA